MQVDPQLSGDYVLPVGMTDLQKKVTSAIVSSNFSEILSFFDGSEQSRDKNSQKLQKMLIDLSLVATHPYLLLTHLQPSLTGKRTPLAIENMSGKFQSLITLAKKFTNPNQHIAVVCEAGHATDLVELVLLDRALNVTRYSSQPAAKFYKKEISKRRGAMFHLVPSDLKDLRQAVYAAFDILIVLDNKFDANSPYGQGLRAQLRDPARRKPFASILRLVALNSAQHVGLFPDLAFAEQIAATVVWKKQVGALPPIVKQFYLKDLNPLQPFFNNCDGKYLLPAMYPIKTAGHHDVEKALYLDDEDQYQVDFGNRKSGSNSGSRKQKRGTESDDEEPGSDSSVSHGATTGLPGSSGLSSDSIDSKKWKSSNAAAVVDKPAWSLAKRRRVELETEAVELCKGLSVTNPLSVTLLIQLNDLLHQSREAEKETLSFRGSASRRELQIETLRGHLQQLAAKVAAYEKASLAAERRVEKLRTRNEKLEHDMENKDTWWSSLADELRSAGSDTDRLDSLISKVLCCKDETCALSTKLANEKTRCLHLQAASEASAQYAETLNKANEALTRENEELKTKINDEPAARESALMQQLKGKSVEVSALKTELESLRESIKVQLSSERSSNGRGERRYGRGGRGASRQSSPHLSTGVP